MSSPTPLAVVAAFLERCCADLDAGALKPVGEYLRIFPGHDAALAEEYRRLVEDGDAAEEDPAPGAADFAAGALIEGRFWLGRSSRRDGATVVYAATDERDGGPYVVRRLRAEAPGFALGRERFRELRTLGERAEAARTAGALLPFAGGDDAAGAWIVAAAPRGVALDARAVPAAEACDVVLRAARAVAAAKDAGVVHGDLRPARVFVAPDGAVAVADFGLAPLRGEGLFGPALAENAAESSRYRSLARLRGGTPTPADDAHALAALLYVRLTGRPPFDAPTDERLAEAVAAGKAKAPSALAPCSAALDALCAEAFAPRAGFRDAAAFAAALAAAVARGDPGRPPGLFSRLLRR